MAARQRDRVLAARPHRRGAARRSRELDEFAGRVSDSGEGRWTAIAAIDEGVPAPVLATALFSRFASRGLDHFADQVLSAMRQEFGGHLEKRGLPRQHGGGAAMTGGVHMPSLDGATGWLNSEPLGPAELRGHVVLVDFWTLTCINWLRTEPYVRAWSQAYRDDGLIVIGVHTPEFSFEHEIDRVRQATKEREIDYPVAVDNDYAVWSAFDNHYWPALYFVDEDGIIRDHHFGEGRYEQSERVIQRLLGVERELVAVEGVGVEAEADWDHLRTPETYLGYGRSEHFASPGGAAFDERRAYELPERLRLNHWALAGEWTIGRGERRARPGRRQHRLPVPRPRRAPRAVARSGTEPIPFRVLLDGEAPGASHGVDVDEDGARRAPGRPAVPARARSTTRSRERTRGDHVPRARRRGVRLHVRVTVRRKASSGCSTGIGRPTAASTRPGSSTPPAASHAGRAWPARSGAPAGYAGRTA